MSSGAGRGRGWLHLEKGLQNPGGVPSTMDSLTFYFSSTQVQQYTKLMQLVEQLDTKDDGILLNLKFKAILRQWESDTKSGAEVEASFKYIYAQCRKSLSLAKKLILMVSSYSFNTTKVQDVKIRSLFIKHIQDDFDNRIQMQTLLPNEFRNSLYILTEFYHKARLIDGRTLKILAMPTLQYLHMLLDSGIPGDLELFTSQLYVNGTNLKGECLEKLDELLMRVRQLLTKNSTLTSLSRIWLLLALDVAYNRFSLLPPELYKFYQEELGDAAIANFQGSHSVLIIETSQPSEIPNQHLGTINLLKISPSESALSISESANNANSHQQHQQQQQQDFANHENVEPIREKIGRPILGVGARQQKNQDASANWREEKRANATNWDKSGRAEGSLKFFREQDSWNSKRDNKPYVGTTRNDEQSKEYWNAAKHTKGWEHDDRFDTTYD